MLAVGEHVLDDVDATLFKMSTGFSGGVGGSQQEMCGVLSAGVMLIGAVHGRSTLHEDNDLARDLINRYRERFGSELGNTTCGPLNQQVEAPGGLGECALVGEQGALILLELLGDGADAADGTDAA